MSEIIKNNINYLVLIENKLSLHEILKKIIIMDDGPAIQNLLKIQI
jgi:hypothetical protein